jgi:DNA end-binding protein Ku
MVEIASRIIEQQAGEFDPTGFNDRYEDALRALIAEKEGATPKKDAREPESTNVVDLMAALEGLPSRQTPTGGPSRRRKPSPRPHLPRAARRRSGLELGGLTPRR